MKLSLTWLREFVPATTDAADLAQQLTMQGLEVEGLEAAAAPLAGVVVGRVRAVESHPNADRLRVCRVDAGGPELRIVCGASNVQAGGTYPVAMVGATLPGGLAIKPANLRGVASAGMLCSASELGLADVAEGLLELPADAAPGTPLADLLDLGDTILDVKITPNRADCLSVLGLARDIAAATGAELRVPPPVPVAVLEPGVPAARSDDAADCPRFGLRAVRNVRPNAASPLWLRERLRRAGVRSVNAVVDVTNLVMLELGQPLHAYDLDKLSGGLVARRGRAGERLVLLGGTEVDVDADALVIADDSGPVGLAGVMGGQRTAVSELTTNVLLEAAHFSPRAIAGRARRFGLHTEAGLRFERGVDPALPERALERATGLLVELAQGRPGPVQVTGDVPRHSAPIVLRRARLAALLGHAVADRQVGELLERLGMRVVSHASGWQVEVPSFRFDVTEEVDLIEEVARLAGYDRIPTRVGVRCARLGRAPRAELALDRAVDLLVDRGYHEAITFSFVDRGLDAQLTGSGEAQALLNPIASDMGVLRRSLWPGLVSAALHNLARQQRRVRLFEAGTRFAIRGGQLHEEQVLSGVVIGPAWPEQWASGPARADFHDVKADLDALFALRPGGDEVQFSAGQHPALQPGQTALLRIDDEELGWLGGLHPRLVASFGFAEQPILFELRTTALQNGRVEAHVGLSRFPAIRRDVAVRVAADIEVARLKHAAVAAGKPLLQDVLVFDIFAGKGIESGQKSVALGLILQDTSRTLTDVDADAVVAGILARLAEDFDARLRQ
jgi:phenylalanyl-tRNA synthetase beta chain